jgi:hypothetical protein
MMRRVVATNAPGRREARAFAASKLLLTATGDGDGRDGGATHRVVVLQCVRVAPARPRLRRRRPRSGRRLAPRTSGGAASFDARSSVRGSVLDEKTPHEHQWISSRSRIPRFDRDLWEVIAVGEQQIGHDQARNGVRSRALAVAHKLAERVRGAAADVVLLHSTSVGRRKVRTDVFRARFVGAMSYRPDSHDSVGRRPANPASTALAHLTVSRRSILSARRLPPRVEAPPGRR